MQMTYDNDMQPVLDSAVQMPDDNEDGMNSECVYAGFFIRLAAYMLDILFVNAMLMFVRVPVWCFKLAMDESCPLFSPILFTYNIFDILYYLLTVGYFILATYLCGNTLGKYLLRIKVVSVDGQKLSFMSVLVRETVGRYLSALIVYFGYLFAGLDNKKQSLHDKISDTYVVYRNMSGECRG